MDSSGTTTAVMGGRGIESTPGNNIRGGRRNSNTMFAGLVNQKRNSVDAAAAARRASFNEMKPTPGFIGKFWNNFTTGSAPK